jgi:enoyl-CoA hydratase
MGGLKETIRRLSRGAVAVVTVDEQAPIDAGEFSTARELARLFSTLQSDPSVRVVILFDAGASELSTGADQPIDTKSERRAPDTAGEIAREWRALLELIWDLGKPVIAAVNGRAFGPRLDLALACGWRAASVRARFAYPNPTGGEPPGPGVCRLARVIGPSRALEMVLTGEELGAEDAMRIGLVDHVAETSEALRGVCEELAEKIARNAPLATKYALEAINLGSRRSLADGLLLESTLFGACFLTEDAREGTRAFLEKRLPNFRGS